MLRNAFEFVRDLAKDAKTLLLDPDREIEQREAFLHELEGKERAELLILDRQTALAIIPYPAYSFANGFSYRNDAIIGLSDERGYEKGCMKKMPSPTI